MRYRARLLVTFTAAASTLAVVLTAAGARSSDVVVTALVLAGAWAACISVFDAVVMSRRREMSPVTDARSPVTYIVRVGEERRDIARTSIVLAAQAGPVHVVATSHREVLDELGGVDVIEHIAPTIQQAVHDAAATIDTDAVLLLSASAFPVGESCEIAAAQLTGGVGWVIGTAPAFNNDRYAPRQRELLSTRMRNAARRFGLVIWEPDATIVRTSLLREHPLDPAKPYGCWLRSRTLEGYRGLMHSDPIAVQAAPADAPVFWPARTRRQRGVVADLADATTFGPFRLRALSAATLLRELFAYPMLLWLTAIVLIGRSGEFPLRVSPVTFFAVQGSLSVARWASSRVAYGIGLHPIEEARATAYDLPGSLLALPSALTRRVRRSRLMLPDQPLLWAAITLTLVSTAPLVDRRAETNSAIGVAVGLTLVALATSWVFAMRAFGARGWDRASYRIALDRPATVDGQPARTIDASPAGLGLTGVPDALAPGARVAVSVAFDDASTFALQGSVTDRRTADGQASVGIALDLDAEEQGKWVVRLFSAAGLIGRLPIFSDTRKSRRPLAFERQPARVRRVLGVAVPATVMVGVSTLVAGALVLTFFGYRPLVDRSGSMVPALHVGDVVVNELVRADRIRPGEIVTFAQEFDRTELVTHRVQSIRVDGGTVKVVTKGDANVAPERWSVSSQTLVGRVVWRVPRIGSLLVLLGSTLIRRLLLAAGLAGLLFGASVAWRSVAARRSAYVARLE